MDDTPTLNQRLRFLALAQVVVEKNIVFEERLPKNFHQLKEIIDFLIKNTFFNQGYKLTYRLQDNQNYLEIYIPEINRSLKIIKNVTEKKSNFLLL